jgi:hypothetical protein
MDIVQIPLKSYSSCAGREGVGWHHIWRLKFCMRVSLQWSSGSAISSHKLLGEGKGYNRGSISFIYQFDVCPSEHEFYEIKDNTECFTSALYFDILLILNSAL